MIYEVASRFIVDMGPFFFFKVYDLVTASIIIVWRVCMCEPASVGLCLSCSLWGHPVLQRQWEQSFSTGAVRWTHMQRSWKLNQSVDRWDSCYSLNNSQPSTTYQPLRNAFLFSFLQVLCSLTSATMCLAVWRSSSLSAALATGTAGMRESWFVGQMGSSIRTCARWKCLPAEMGRASSRFRCPSVLTVSALSPHMTWKSQSSSIPLTTVADLRSVLWYK